MAATLMGDDQWLDDKFFPENIKRLSEAYSYTVNTLGEIGIKAFRAKVKVKMRSYFLISTTLGWTLCVAGFQEIFKRENQRGRDGTFPETFQ